MTDNIILKVWTEIVVIICKKYSTVHYSTGASKIYNTVICYCPEELCIIQRKYVYPFIPCGGRHCSSKASVVNAKYLRNLLSNFDTKLIAKNNSISCVEWFDN